MARWSGFWSRRTDVQRVELYTSVSLYLGVWSLILIWPVNAPKELMRDPVVATVVILTAVAMGVVGMWGVRVALEHPGGVDPARPAARRLLIGTATTAAVLCAVGAVLLPEGSGGIVVTGTVFGAMAWIVGAMPNRVVIATVVVMYAAGILMFGASALPALAWVIIFVFVLGILRASLWIMRVVQELDEARSAQSRLAVAEERLRFSRDVHDVLGRHLSTIAVRSELAARLAERDAQRATQEMMEVRAAAQDALREARALARGYRETDLQAELDGAASLLASAGIRSTCTLDSLPDRLHEPAAWVIREGITNVLRHADASEVTIAWEPDESAGIGTVTIENNGARTESDENSGGAGIAGLGERLAPIGATVDVHRDGERFALIATFPVAESAAP